jgi:hypothetical protein
VARLTGYMHVNMRRFAWVVAGALALAGCGSGDKSHARARTQAVAKPRAATLVFMQRNGGLAATLDTVAVRTDGSVHLERRYGGAGGQFTDFRLRSADLRRLKARMGAARLADPGRPYGRAQAHGYTYILRGEGHTDTALAGAVPRRLRPLVTMLDAVLDDGVPRLALSEVAVSKK